MLPSYWICLFCNGFWPQNTTPENIVTCNGIISTQCQKGFCLYNCRLIISSLMLDPLNHCYFTLFCYVASILTIKGKAVKEVHINVALSLTHNLMHHLCICLVIFRGKMFLTSPAHNLCVRWCIVLALKSSLYL